MFELPDPRRVEIKIFGVEAVLSERTTEERRDIEKAFADRNGVDSDALTYALTFKIIESALVCNLRTSWKFNLIGRIFNQRWNRLFSWEYLRKHLTESQVEFLIDKINELDYGDKYEEIKKKMLETKPEPDQPQVKLQATKQSGD